MKSEEKLIDAMTQLLEAYTELQATVESDCAVDETDDADEQDSLTTEVDAALITEMHSVLEVVMDSEEYSSEEIAGLISTMSEALEEIDPDVFESGEEESVVEYEAEEEYYDDDDDEEIEDFDEDFEEDDEDSLDDDDDEEYDDEDEEEDED